MLLQKTQPLVGTTSLHQCHQCHLPESSLQVLLDLYNETWRQQQLPKEWKHSKIVPVLKPQKDPTKAVSHRPISLTSVPCKVMERMVNNRLTWYLERNNLLSPIQSGFRSNRNTMDNIIRLENAIQSTLRHGEFLVVVTLDLEKAYDLMWVNGLLCKLHQLGIRGKMLGWLRSFLTKRTSQVVVGGVGSRLFKCQNGSPQGGVVCPTVFIVMTNNVANHQSCVLSGRYADDEKRWYRHKHLPTLKGKLEEDLALTVADYRRWGFKVAATKTTATVFTLNEVPDDFNIVIEGANIPVGKTVKILGITLDRKLTWNDHIRTVEAHCNKTLQLLRRITGYSWGTQAKDHGLLVGNSSKGTTQHISCTHQIKNGLRWRVIRVGINVSKGEAQHHPKKGAENLFGSPKVHCKCFYASRSRRDAFRPTS